MRGRGLFYVWRGPTRVVASVPLCESGINTESTLKGVGWLDVDSFTFPPSIHSPKPRSNPKLYLFFPQPTPPRQEYVLPRRHSLSLSFTFIYTVLTSSLSSVHQQHHRRNARGGNSNNLPAPTARHPHRRRRRRGGPREGGVRLCGRRCR